MPYLIDGHNLIGQLPDLSLDDPHDEAKLIERLKGFMAHRRKRCTVVFDGGLPGGPSRDLSTGSVRVIFAHGGTTADRIILERLHNTADTHAWVVVTADREIIAEAQRCHARVQSPADFAREMHSSHETHAPTTLKDNPNPRLSPQDVEEWLRLFGAQDEDAQDHSAS